MFSKTVTIPARAGRPCHVLALGVLLRVDHEGAGVFEESAQQGFGFGRELHFGKGFVHDGEPSVARGLIDFESGVAHAEAGVAALFDVAHGAAEAADEEIAEALLGSGEVVFGVDVS